jgi:hypothetical protein
MLADGPVVNSIRLLERCYDTWRASDLIHKNHTERELYGAAFRWLAQEYLALKDLEKAKHILENLVSFVRIIITINYFFSE